MNFITHIILNVRLKKQFIRFLNKIVFINFKFVFKSISSFLENFVIFIENFAHFCVKIDSCYFVNDFDITILYLKNLIKYK